MRIELERLSTNDKPKHSVTATLLYEIITVVSPNTGAMALLAEYATVQTTEIKISDFLWGAAWGVIAALSAISIFLGLRA
jgi:hypothetical protein